ncbi:MULTISPECIES: flagellar export chaperone FliS [Chromohalobacter]|uniref:Flagellar secretion chaperone FliS n=2 Tax=Chromohalobacter TaxID=42054 RepID=A0A285VVT6_9GAMM|nr:MULTISPECIES: flagellar export chaperone FliS [Chromohalobacter]MCK0768786.1 flagellar export chaperone FliS [Chromohalobacter canadensis]MCT8469857.1 flagellar export chaperone FliS [Chromohalobacter canadensis]MCT8472309.1 flagellar export chaperone FliS [Chromohalobacter canadensis]MCT8499579.1 flagellar export chaperone FliS [Chromohalobacter canadensis]MCT8505892.1 flagellar export chaperone FliS [Chromohalobacter moromii]
MNMMRGAQAYARVGVESGVMSASPHQLIVMLFDGAQASIRAAKMHMEDGNISAKGQAITKALNIVNNGLAAALDHERGGELSERLGSLYDYIARLLLRANLRNDQAALDEAAHLLEDIGSAWREIAPQVDGS